MEHNLQIINVDIRYLYIADYTFSIKSLIKCIYNKYNLYQKY